MAPSVKSIRDALPPSSRERTMRKGVTYFAVALVAYAGTFVAMVVGGLGWTLPLFAVVNGLTVGILFIVGHDACHGSLTPNARVNKWLGRVAFLPSLHPFAAWEYSHNALHHGFTNLRGKDPVYCPMTLQEYRALSSFRQSVERLYRSWLGILPLYLCTIWWPLEIKPSSAHRVHIDKRGTFSFDRALVLIFPVLQACTAILIMLSRGNADPVAVTTVTAAATILPFLAFTWLIGFATFQHHTHPRVIWYGGESEWTFFRAQVQGTVHVEFPRWLETLLNNIMEHTAHHVDTRVPLYNLTGAQDALEAAYGDQNVIRERFTFAGMSSVLRCCQLYDYTSHRWLTFDGVPTTPPRVLEGELLMSAAV